MNYTDQNKRPQPLAPKLDSVPSELRSVKQWVMWKYVWKGDVWAKIPFRTNGVTASSTDPNTWEKFDTVFLCYEQQQSRFDGIGFVFTDSAFVGIDLDNCLNGKEMTPFALRVCEKLETYTEVSPSKTGLHLIGKAKDIEAVKTQYKGNQIEIYKTGRYFTFTGWSAQPQLEVVEVETPLKEIITAVKPPKKEISKIEVVEQSQSLTLSNESRLKMALKRENTKRWFDGDISDFGGDDSRADMALARNLAFFCDGNRDILDWMFRQSKLMRPKWDERRGNDTYGNITLNKILETQENYASFTKIKDANPKTDYESRKSRRLTFDSLWDSTMAYRQSGDSRGVDCGWNNLTKLYRPAKGQFTVITGLPASGKSTFLDVLCYNISRLHKWKFTFASFETLPMQRHILNFCQIHLQKPTFTFIDDCATDAEMEEARKELNEYFHFIMPSDDELTIEGVFQYVADDIKDFGISGFVLDPYTELDEKRGYGISETEHIKQVLKYGQRFTRHNQIHWWLIAHPVKSGETYLDGRPSLRSIAGSQNFYNKVDNGLIVHRTSDNRTKVFVDKVRFDINGEQGEAEFDYDVQRRSYTPVGAEWLEEAEEFEQRKEWSF